MSVGGALALQVLLEQVNPALAEAWLRATSNKVSMQSVGHVTIMSSLPRGRLVLSSPRRAAALAQKLGERVLPGGGLYRVQLEPYADIASAEHARVAITRAGYGDARILHSN